MKIRNPLAIKWVGFLGAIVIRLWMSTVRYRYFPLGPTIDPRRRDWQERGIYCFWHENILLPAYLFGSRKVKLLISQHADGEMMARASMHLGFGVVRGSTTRGGILALRKLIRHAANRHHLAIVPDGPRGPRRHVEIGMIYLASSTGMPIFTLGIGYRSAWRLNSWDRFALPKPYTEAAFVTLKPIYVPANLNRAGLEQYRIYVEQALTYANDLAEQLASGELKRASTVIDPVVKRAA